MFFGYWLSKDALGTIDTRVNLVYAVCLLETTTKLITRQNITSH